MDNGVLKPDRAKKTGGDGIAPTKNILKATTITMKKDHLLRAVEEYLYRFYGEVRVSDISEVEDTLFLVKMNA
jgi:hypothetical protein